MCSCAPIPCRPGSMRQGSEGAAVLEMTASDFADLAIRLHDEPTVVETVDYVVQYALKAVDCQYAGVMPVHNGQKVETAASTDPLVEQLDQIQIECGEGPGLDLTERMTLRVADTELDRRWENWAQRVAERGVRSVLVAKLSTGTDDLGTLN